MKALDHYENLYGNIWKSDGDASKFVFVSGWNCALQEMMTRVNAMPFPADTRASFAIYFQQMMEIDPTALINKVQQ